MYHRLLGVLFIATVAGTGAVPAGAEEYQDERTPTYVREAPVKDCTRYNGQFGYYGNPWCTPAEQARWDAWSARKH